MVGTRQIFVSPTNVYLRIINRINNWKVLIEAFVKIAPDVGAMTTNQINSREGPEVPN